MPACAARSFHSQCHKRTVHVEDQVLTHDGKADEADIGTATSNRNHRR